MAITSAMFEGPAHTICSVAGDGKAPEGWRTPRRWREWVRSPCARRVLRPVPMFRNRFDRTHLLGTSPASFDRHDFPLESQRDSGSKPRVARNELPWVNGKQIPQPQRGCDPKATRHPTGHNPFGVGARWRPLPKGSAGRQPWALGHNPFGIAKSLSYRFIP